MQVRVVGGAYGAMNVYQPNTGIFKYVSYRDPNLKQTLDVYDGTSKFLNDLSKEMSPSALANAIIGMVGDMDSPMSPDQKGFTSMDRCVFVDKNLCAVVFFFFCVHGHVFQVVLCTLTWEDYDVDRAFGIVNQFWMPS